MARPGGSFDALYSTLCWQSLENPFLRNPEHPGLICPSHATEDPPRAEPAPTRVGGSSPSYTSILERTVRSSRNTPLPPLQRAPPATYPPASCRSPGLEEFPWPPVARLWMISPSRHKETCKSQKVKASKQRRNSMGLRSYFDFSTFRVLVVKYPA